MNESPGWASPGSSPSEPDGSSQTPQGSQPSQPDQPQPESGWSRQQPPPATPGGWGVPTGPSSGQPGGQWRNTWQPPPAAKPGVIPLRPLDVSEILDGAVSTIRAHWRPALGISLGIAIVLETISTLSTGLWFRENDKIRELGNTQAPTASQITDAYTEAINAQLIPILATTVATVLATAMLTMVVSRAVLGRSVSIGEAWQDARPSLLRLLGLSLLVTLVVVAAVLLGMAPGLLLMVAGATTVGALLLALGGLGGVALGIWLWVRLSLSAPALMLEKQGVIAAMQRSAKLVKDSWWRVFGIQILVVVLVMVLAFVVTLVTSLVGLLVTGADLSGMIDGTSEQSWSYLLVLGIGAVISSTLTLPFAAGVTALVYIDRRIRREALDLELARAAGVTGYGTPEPGGPTPGQ